MLSSKGQISIFIIVGVISVLVVSYLIGSGTVFKEGPSSQQIQDSEVLFLEGKNYVDSCVGQILKNGLIVIGVQGGYFNPEIYNIYSQFRVPYYFDGEKSYVPDEDKVKVELSDLISSNFYLCIMGLMSEQDVIAINISEEDYVETEIRFSDYEVYVEVEFPIIYTFNGITKTYSSYSADSYFVLNEKLDLSQKIIAEHEKDPYFIPLSFMNELAYENDFKYEVVELGNNDVLYTLLFDKAGGKEQYPYSFVIKYKEFEG